MSKTKKPVSKSKVKKTSKKVDITPITFVRAGESQLRSFFDFIRNQGVVGLAVGLVLGGAVSVMVKSLVDNVVMPPLGLILGSAEGLKGLSWTMSQTVDGKPVILHYGIFLNDTINFIVIALVIYVTVSLLKVEKFDKKKD